MAVAKLRFVKRTIRRNALRRGVLGGERFWMGVFVLGLLGRQANKVLKRGEMPLRFSERLEPGQSFVISHLAPEPRRRRR